jgi:hypothetical protein
MKLRIALLAMPALALSMAVALAAEPEDVTQSSVPANTSEAPDHLRSDHLDGHIAFLKAELGITPAQAAAWQRVTEAMRLDVKEYADATAEYASNSPTPPSAVESLRERATFVDLRARGEQRFLAAFGPLYDSMSAEQKKKADELFANRADD